MPNLAKAVVKLIQDVGPIEKNMDIGKGQNAYKGVADKDVKLKVGKAMAENGLCLLPVGVTANESTFVTKDYNGNDKNNFFTSVVTDYLLLHTSGESMVIKGYGHGIDSQDKSAGKATTYALKYLLLYLSMAATGTIDDSDATHSDDIPAKTVVPPAKSGKETVAQKTAAQSTVDKFEKEGKTPAQTEKAPVETKAEAAAESKPADPKKRQLTVGDEKWPRVVDWIVANKGAGLDALVAGLKAKNEFGADVVEEIKKLV